LNELTVGIVGLNIHTPWAEGVANNIKELCRSLRNRNVSIVLITNKIKEMPRVEDMHNMVNIELFVPFTAQERTLKYKINYLFFFVALSLYLPLLISRYKVDIVHFHLGLNPFYVWFAFVSRAKNIPLIWTMYTPAALNTSIIPRKFVLGVLARVICIDKFCEETLASCKFSGKTVRVPMPLDINKFSPCSKHRKREYREKLDLPDGKILILYAGHFTKGRGVDTLLRAYDLLISEKPVLKIRSRLVLASSGINESSYFSQIKEYVQRRGLKDNVLLLGCQVAVEELFNAVDVLVFPAYDLGHVISTPRTILEAMLSEKIVVATDVGGVEEAIRDGENGFIIEPRNVALLGKVLEKVITQPGACLLMQKRGRETIVNSCASDIVTEKILDIYSSCLGARVQDSK